MATDDDPQPAPLSDASDALRDTPYRAVRMLGRGAMGEVVLAEHRGLKKPVVVKLLHTKLVDNRDLVDRMRVEAQALARMSSPNLVQVTDSGVTPGGRPYYVMELLRGATLRDELKARGALPVAEAFDVVRQILSGLAVVHEAGFVHRDVKLDNIFYCEAMSGHRAVKLLDFGLVKVLSRGGGVEPPARATEEGVAMGTPRYFSPEQALGRPVDARSDLYSVGVVLYALLAGRGPFDDKKGLANLIEAQVSARPPPPSRFAASSLPAAVDELVLRALEKDAEKRYPSADAFSRAIASCPPDGPSDDPTLVDARIDDSATTIPIERATLPLQKAAREATAPPASPTPASPAEVPADRFAGGQIPHVRLRRAPRGASWAADMGPPSSARSSPPAPPAPESRRGARRGILVSIAIGLALGIALMLLLLARG